MQVKKNPPNAAVRSAILAAIAAALLVSAVFQFVILPGKQEQTRSKSKRK
ncbi:hypothetical protein [Kingella potus]|nr:hypothetical protein [Kingella potus]UOP01600.1 hypothetical protein LVJ84_05365 [Kingella potus]